VTSRLRGGSMSKPRVGVDWDGTCVENVWPAEGDWLPGAVEALHDLSPYYTLIVDSCRISPLEAHDHSKLRDPAIIAREIAYIRRMLDEAGLTHVEIWTKLGKLPADYYIDDKGIHFNGRRNAWAAITMRLLLQRGFTS
jgi:hypothetical protein